MAAPEKPLPDLPRARRLSTLTLTTDARAHLRRSLLRFLEQEADIREKETWAEKIQIALDELGANLARGGWLAGLKRARYVRKRHHDEEEKRRIEEKGRRDKEEEERLKNRSAKGRSKLREAIVEDNVEDTRDDGVRNVSLEQLRQIIARSPLPVSQQVLHHLLLTVAGSPLSEPSEDMGFKLVRSAVHCSFKPGEFALPKAYPNNDSDDAVLYGLDDWDAYLLSIDDHVQIVGGTFSLIGVPSNTQHHALCRVLRLAIFLYLSLLLERELFSNSHLELHYRKPTPSFPSVPERSSTSPNIKDRAKRESGSGLWSFLSKKTEDLLHRATHVAPAIGGRRGSVDLGFGQKFARHTSMPYPPEGGFLTRQLSLLSSVSSSHVSQEGDRNEVQYEVALQHVDTWKDLLSTSPGVVFPLPTSLAAIAEQEKKDPTRRLVGDEKAALSSLLGWHHHDSSARGMVGVPGFVRHQGLTVLYSEHVPGGSNPLSPPPTPSKADTSMESTEMPAPLRIACGGHRHKWINYRYYQRGRRWDETLGEAIIRWCSTAQEPCIFPDCPFQRADHDMRWVHGNIRLLATVSSPSTELSTSDDVVRMWVACAVCGKETTQEVMRDGTYLFSFSKFLELLVYSPAIHTLHPVLCEHTSLPPKPWTGPDLPIPPTRFNIIRRFSHKDTTVTLILAGVKEVFEVRVPRLQIVRRKLDKIDPGLPRPVTETGPGSTRWGEAHKTLRREIMKWWQGMSEHMDQLEEKFITDYPNGFHKSLPRLPSSDDGHEGDEDPIATPTPSHRPLPPPSTPITPKARSDTSFPFYSASRTVPSSPAASEPSTTSSALTSSTYSQSAISETDADSLQLLTGLRHKFQQTEQGLYTELSQTPEKSLNDVRRSFVTAARGATRRIGAWAKKHLDSETSPSEVPILPNLEPEWWKSGCHAVPGGNIIVREDDWGSIIAFSLSTIDYQRELSNMNGARNLAPAPPPTTPTVTRPSLFSPSESFKRLVSGSAPQQPDPDNDDAGWQEPETYSAVISRKEHPREPVSLMSIRDVLRQKTSADAGSSSPSLISSAGSSNGKASGTETPRSVRAKPAVEISTLAADGQVSGMPEAVEAAGKILHDLEAVAKANSSRSSLSDSRRSSSGMVETAIRRGKTASLISGSDGSTVHDLHESVSSVAMPPPLPPKDVKEGEGEEARKSSMSADSEPPPTPSKTGSSMFTAAFANTLSSAMRYVLPPGETPRPVSHAPHHGLLSADTPAIDERPHIKYDWTVGKRLRFSCTVYYAKQFDQLRKRCGIDDVFLKSMARSENWTAEGGKSRSNFWKTTDNRFIIKTLVNAWNVADLQVLIDLGPSYFKYMEATASRPTVLAKLLGFYTVEIRNLESGATQAKADLLVMENLFYNQTITKTFDLKGIQGRRVKASGGGAHSKTLFDGEWIEGQQRALTLVQSHSKVILQEAVKADCEFLAKSNIMDYSLLLGINEEKKEMVCGLVDAIGSYTFAKTLEYKVKQNVNSGKEVTVVPPNEYQERFVSAMDEYFLACPDKWSKPLDNTPIPSDYRDLPSVL